MANIQYYDVILKPVITEKSMEMMADKDVYKRQAGNRGGTGPGGSI